LIEKRNKLLDNFIGKNIKISNEFLLVLATQFKDFIFMSVENEFYTSFKSFKNILIQEYDFISDMEL
jgi:hypothetical protein